jgi:positive regulator of sigma E activity
VGDLVKIELNSKTVFKSAFVLYLMPAIGLLLGAISGNGLIEGQGLENPSVTIVLAFVGLAAGFAIAATFSRWMSARNKLTPIVTGIIKQRS